MSGKAGFENIRKKEGGENLQGDSGPKNERWRPLKELYQKRGVVELTKKRIVHRSLDS